MKKITICLIVFTMMISFVSLSVLSQTNMAQADSDSIGMFANWHFNQNNLKEVNAIINNNELVTNDGLYFQAYDGYISGRMFYFGLQTRREKPGYGLAGKGLIFAERELFFRA